MLCSLKHRIITTAIVFICHNNFFLINDAPFIKLVTSNVAQFDVTLFDLLILYYLICAVSCWTIFKLCYLMFHWFDVARFQYCTSWCFTIFMLYYLILDYFRFQYLMLHYLMLHYFSVALFAVALVVVAPVVVTIFNVSLF